LNQDPVDDPDGPQSDTEMETAAEPVLEPPPEAGAVAHFERRARLAEDRLTEVLAAYRQVKTENEGFRDRVTRDVERQFDRRHEKLLLKFIEILDNLDRALEAAEQTYAGNPLIDGLISASSCRPCGRRASSGSPCSACRSTPPSATQCSPSPWTTPSRTTSWCARP
jgi:molecular chaperone GrpE (heat shock protein)